MLYTFWVKQPYKDFLLNWQKTIEGRLNKGKFKILQPGDILKLESWEKFIVINKKHYPTFKQMLQNEWLNNVLPNINDIEEWVKIYYQFYTPTQEKEFWVLAIKLKKLNK